MSDIELQPVLAGNTIRLRPLVPADFDALYMAASDPGIWEQHPDSKRYQRDVFRQRFFDGAVASGSALVIEELAGGKVIGSSRYYDWKPESREIAIGYTFLAREHWGDGTNRELKQLMLGHIAPWVDAIWFHVGESNLRSRRAVEKLGAKLVSQKSQELEGQTFTQLYYRLDKGNG